MTYHIPEWSRAIGPCLLIGRQPHGLWVVKDERNLCGGFFTNQADAIRFAMAERERRPQSLVLLPDGVECDPPLGGSPEAN